VAMPEDALSSERVPALLVGARALPVTQYVDYEDGGVAIQDPSQGLNFQVWRARIIGNQIIIDAPSVDPFVIYEAVEELAQVSLSFDQNMQPVLAFTEGEVTKLRWFDSLPNSFVITEFPGLITPRVFLDDKREAQSAISDVLFAYIKPDKSLAHRKQRDRYLIEYPLDPGPWDRLVKIGFNRQLRVQFIAKRPNS